MREVRGIGDHESDGLAHPDVELVRYEVQAADAHPYVPARRRRGRQLNGAAQEEKRKSRDKHGGKSQPPLRFQLAGHGTPPSLVRTVMDEPTAKGGMVWSAPDR